MAAAVATLTSLADECVSDVSPLRVRQEEQGAAGEYLVRRRTDGDDFIEVRVAVVGNVDAGKRSVTQSQSHTVTHSHTQSHTVTQPHIHVLCNSCVKCAVVSCHPPPLLVLSWVY